MKTKTQALNWIDKSEGKQYNFDLYAGFQCYDYANAYFNYMTGRRLTGLFAKNIPFDNKAIKPKAKAKAKSQKIMLVAGHGYADPGAVGNGTNERDFIRKNITPIVAKHLRDAGHEVALYGGTKQAQDMYQDTAYGVRVGNKRDYGLYWVNKQKYDVVVEIHL
ncbi:MAG: N-acetylmuramoyl-L-alanine amidase, partial [Rickettsia endosymbiont of Ixodes persulcatus]|nr:N-acetylmuramoyl-L-alanine amidase [Rickettsia endosymbiont of Ixodes persulcatus]